jgi:hypothetical protein
MEMNENFKYIAAAVAVVGLTIGSVVYIYQGKKPKPAAPPPATAQLPPETAEPEVAEPAVKHPLPEPATPEALPSLDDSGPSVQGAIAGVFGQEFADKFVIQDQLVRHIVVSIDNLPEQKLAERIRPVKPVPGAFAAGGTVDAPVLDSTNYERYKPLVQLIQNTDTKQLAAMYKRYYPLFQEAYANLGHPPEYFNDRLVQVIDHLLETPDVQGPIALTQPGLRYEFADQAVESRSAGQKILIRMGSANAAVIKEKLKQLRAEVISSQSPSQ